MLFLIATGQHWKLFLHCVQDKIEEVDLSSVATISATPQNLVILAGLPNSYNVCSLMCAIQVCISLCLLLSS